MSIDGRTRSASAVAGSKPRLHDEHDQRAVRLILDGLVRLRACALRRDRHACTSYPVFKEPTATPSRGCRVPDARCAPSGGPKSRPKPIFGEPYKSIKPTGPCQPLFSATARDFRGLHRLPWPVRHRTATASAGLIGLAFRVSCLGARSGPTWGRTPKAKFDNTRRGWACQPLSVVDARGPSLGPLRRPRTPARFHGTLPHIRQANVLVTFPG